MEEHREGSIPLEQLSRNSAVSSSDETPIYHEHGPNTPPGYYAHAGSGSSPHDEPLPSYGQLRSTGEMIGRGHSARIHRSVWVSFGTVLYVAMALYAWVAIAVLSFRPLKGKSWGYSIKDKIYDRRHPAPDYTLDKNIYRSAQIIQTIVQVATLPWITAVCASAAVIYTQYQKNATDLRLRKVMALADRRWNEFSLYWSVAHGGWNKHGSALLSIAMFVWIFGAIVYPIQSVFLSTQAIKVQVRPSQKAKIFDFVADGYFSLDPVPAIDVLNTRADLSKADNNAYQPNLWNNDSGVSFLTLGTISSKTFYSQVPSGFNTGLLRQFAPRLNSTASYETLNENEFPADCDASTDSFYADYSSTFSYYSYKKDSFWGVVACMPANLTNSPWNLTRSRQDFSENLYLNLSYTDGNLFENFLYRITVNTTAGYFELPNYLNNGIPGPLLDDDPSTSLCDKHCMTQDYWHSYQTHYRRDEDTSNATTLQNASWSSYTAAYKGPLLMTALATFGPNSFFDTFTASYEQLHAETNASGGVNYVCISSPPLLNLLLGTTYSRCIKGSSDYYNYYPASSLVTEYIQAFTEHETQFPAAFTAAAYLANQNFMKQLPGLWYVYQDLGADMDVPSVSLAGVIVVSILMGLYLIPLLCLSVYSGRYPRWTSRLDSFVMLRFGAFAGDKVFPLLVTRNPDEVIELDEMPGVVRDISVPSEDEVIKIGKLGFGEGVPLQRDHRYECFKADDERLTDWESRDVRAGVRRRN